MSKDSDTPFPGSNCYTGTQSERLDRIERTIGEVKTALVGNARMGHRGIVHRIADVEASVENHNRKLVFATGFLAAFVAAFEIIRHKLFD
jgi:hypothetical protein